MYSYIQNTTCLSQANLLTKPSPLPSLQGQCDIDNPELKCWYATSLDTDDNSSYEVKLIQYNIVYWFGHLILEYLQCNSDVFWVGASIPGAAGVQQRENLSSE